MGASITQTQSYIPTTDAGFRDWLYNFQLLIAQDPDRYGLEQTDATVITGLYNNYNAAYQTVLSPSTRTPNAIAQKDAQRASATASCRVYAQMIKSNAGVDNDDKIALGIHVDDPTPTPIPAPTSAPILSIVAAFSGEHIIRYADETTPASRRKPPGATHMQLNRTVDVGANPDPTVSTQVGMYTKQPINVAQDPMDAGKTATYFARWMNAKGEFGPWSLPIAMTIAFGGPVDQEMPEAA